MSSMKSGGRFFFVHVMKTAGTSFVRRLRQEFPAEALYPCPAIDWIGPHDFEAYINIPRLLALTPERRAEIRMYTGHFPSYVTEEIDPDVTTLTLLRHPLDRTISVLKHFKREEPKFRDASLEEIYDDRETFRFFIENHQTKVFSLAAEDGEDAINCGLTIDRARLERAQAQLARIDVVGLTERYDDFCAELHDRFGWWSGGVDADARTNVSRLGDEVPAALRVRIEADNAFDLAFYEYAERLVRSR
jgi:hypothetical protein